MKKNNKKILQKCLSCKYWVHECIDNGHICCNPDSTYCADWTEAKDWCHEWVMLDESGLQEKELCDPSFEVS